MAQPPLPPRWAPGSFLARLPPEHVAELLRAGVPRELGPGRALMWEGDASTHVEVLLNGFVKITNQIDGVEVLVGIRVPGDLIGELAGLTDEPRSATATACGKVISAVVSRAAFHRFLRQHPEAALRMAAAVGDRLRWATERQAEFAAFPAEKRLARVLVDIAWSCGQPTEEGVTIGVQLSQPELATMVGASEATVQKVLRGLRMQGIIRTGYRRITVADLPALRALGD